MTTSHNIAVDDERLAELIDSADHGAKKYDCTNDADVAKLLRELQQRREAERWVSVAERMPDHDGFYEVASDDWRPPQVYVLECRDTAYLGHGCWRAVGAWSGTVTHWRPLPKPPEDG